MGIIQKAELTDCELTVMKIIWDAGEPITCGEIQEQLRNTYNLVYKDTTVYTFLKNLREKCFVDTYRRGVTFFVPIRNQEEYRKDIMQRMKKFWYNDDISFFLTSVGQDENFDEKDIAKLRRIVSKYK